MSHIEIIMYIVLGFAMASLIALFLGRLIWNYAVNVGRRRMQRAAPSTLAELQTERDRLRAEYAMLARKLELRLDDLKTRLAEQMAEASRQRNRIDQLSEELKQRDALLAERQAEVEQLKQQLGPFEEELAARTEALQELKEQLRQRDESQAEMSRQLDAARQAIAERDREIVRLTGELERAIAGETSAPRDLTAHDRLGRRIDDLTELSRQIEAQRRQIVHQQSEYKTLKESMAELRSRFGLPSTDEAATERSSEPDQVAAAETCEVQGGDGRERDDSIERQSHSLERQIMEAERETAELRSELERLDAAWAEKLAEMAAVVGGELERRETVDGAPVPAEAKAAGGEDAEHRADVVEAGRRPLPGFANVISLANRIRALQRDIRR